MSADREPTTGPEPLRLADRLALRPAEAAKALGICERTLRSWMQNEALPYLRLGGSVLIPVGDLRAWMAQRTGATRNADAIAEEILRDFGRTGS